MTPTTATTIAINETAIAHKSAMPNANCSNGKQMQPRREPRTPHQHQYMHTTPNCNYTPEQATTYCCLAKKISATWQPIVAMGGG
eukprot:7978963-Alexandrium_andersonii.AAC.1